MNNNSIFIDSWSMKNDETTKEYKNYETIITSHFGVKSWLVFGSLMSEIYNNQKPSQMGGIVITIENLDIDYLCFPVHERACNISLSVMDTSKINPSEKFLKIKITEDEIVFYYYREIRIRNKITNTTWHRRNNTSLSMDLTSFQKHTLRSAINELSIFKLGI